MYKGYLWHDGNKLVLGTPNTDPVLISSGYSTGVTFTPGGFVGINKSNPTERLDVAGNINFSGVLKIGGITGLLMEPNRITIGFPNTAGKGFKVSSYNPDNSVANDILVVTQDGTVNVDGKITNSSKTGGANLSPVSYGLVDGTVNPPVILNGTSNFSVTRSGPGYYSIIVTGELITESTHTCLVSIVRNSISGGTLIWSTPSTTMPEGRLLVLCNGTDQKFSFLVYRAN